ncbi:hypothetical protein, partial [Vibrio splendidus]|uniref:hypothetical protein n=1 Tax=Vibrio splendidus TaxID=29497 RepID=UPI003D122286
PGFKGNNILSIANCTGNMAPRTNVARTNIENTEHKNIFLQKVYSAISEHIETELENLCKEFSISWAARESSFILSSLTERIHTRHLMDDEFFLNEELFKAELGKVKFILQEDHQERKLTSLNTLLAEGDFWTVDSVSFHSADSLIKDVSSDSSSASSIFIMNSIQGNASAAKTEHIKKLVCNIGGRNDDLISKYILDKYSVKEIKTFTELRRIDLRWAPTEGQKLWKVISHSNDYGSNSKIYIQTSNLVVLDQSSKGKVIKSSGFTFVLEGSELHRLISNIDFISKSEDSLSREEQVCFIMLGKLITDLFFITNKTSERERFEFHL